MENTHRIIALITADKLRVDALQAVAQLHLPDCYLAAGFVRNLVWDHLHNFSVPTVLNDVDVIYFDNHEIHAQRYQEYESRLKVLWPQINWQVRNQALMHRRNNDKPYLSSLDAMSYWPEKETAIGVRLLSDGNIECISAFGLDSLFNLHLTYNPKRSRSVFEHRIKSKDWLTQWNLLTICR